MIEIMPPLAQSPTSRIAIAGFLALWMVLLVGGSLLPMDIRFALTPSGMITPDRAHLLHVTAHIIAFGVAAVGLAIEWCQHAIYFGPLETWDMRTDVCAVFGVYLLILSKATFTPRRRQ